MRRHEYEAIVATLKRIDEVLTDPCEIVVIGGAAIAVQYDDSHVTTDIDLFHAPGAFWTADQALRASEESLVPIGRAAVADAPYAFEDRVVPLEIGTRNLTVWVPERHDLVMMKTVRGYDHDLQGIEDVHRAHPHRLLLRSAFPRHP